MPLDLRKIEKPLQLADGMIRARCPACAEKGQDTKGEHLRIYPDGKFGCCVFPSDREHRRRIFALVGENKRRGISVKMAAPGSLGSVENNLLQRIGHVMANQAACSATYHPAKETQSELGLLRTPRTGETESKQNAEDHSRTSRTPSFELRAYEKEMDIPKEGPREGVRGVRENAGLPYLTSSGDLVIPFNSPEKFHWWNGGQSVEATLAELNRKAGKV